jgi:hypothetical protein
VNTWWLGVTAYLFVQTIAAILWHRFCRGDSARE